MPGHSFRRMVLCSGFTMDMLMSILVSESRDERRALLFKRLFCYDFEQVDFFLPQLTMMLLNWSYSSTVYLMYYFEFRCSLCSRYAYKLHWSLKTFRPEQKISDVFNHMGQHPTLFLKSQKVRRRRAFSDSDQSDTPFTPSSNGRNLKNEDDFASKLMRIEESMVPLNQSHDLRARHLIQQLKNINDSLRSSLNVWNPLIDYSHSVVSIPIHECFVLNSAKRAPYILFMECVQNVTSQLRKGKHFYSNQSDAATKPIIRSNSEYSCSSTEIDLADSICEDDSFVIVPSVDETSSLDDYDIVSYQEYVLSRIAIRSEKDGLVLTTSLSPQIHSSTAGNAIGEPWMNKIRRMSQASRFNQAEDTSGWFLSACIVKHCDDARNELIAYQFINKLQEIWKLEKVAVHVHPVKTILINKSFALMQVIPNAVSLHQIKSNFSGSLRKYMQRSFRCFLNAQENFVASCAGYSVVCYLLQVKDRHNGNILLGSEGHLIHIDFGYILDCSPGNIAFEQADFKMTPEYVEVMGGVDSDMFKYYKILMMRALIAARKHKESLLPLIRSYHKWTRLKCCTGRSVVERLEKRFLPNSTDTDVYKLIDAMVSGNINALTTRVYDYYQYQSCGIK